MFCYQCEQTAKGQGCEKIGVCGKQPEVSDLQDLLVYALQGLSIYAVEARKAGITDEEANSFTCSALFSTLTNVNFDQKYFLEAIPRAVKIRETLRSKTGDVNGAAPAARFQPASDIAGLLLQASSAGLTAGPGEDSDIRSLKHTLLFGLKGVAAYADHARILGQEDDAVYGFIHEGLASLTKSDLGANDLVGLVLKCGGINLRAMELLDAGNTGGFGHPVPDPRPARTQAGQGDTRFRPRPGRP